jgi:hypothetical protein
MRTLATGCSQRELVEVIEWKDRDHRVQSQQTSSFEAIYAES